MSHFQTVDAWWFGKRSRGRILMTKSCTLKEAFIERQLDKFQPNWRNGEDITGETKQKIKDYVTSQMPDELKESADCITDYSIWHMAKKIRTRENLPEPKKSNKEKKVSVCKSSQTSDASLKALQDEKQEAKALSFDDVVEKLMEIITLSSLTIVKGAIEAIEHDEGLRTQKLDKDYRVEAFEDEKFQ